MKKRVLTFVLTGIMLVSIAACGANKKEVDVPETGTDTEMEVPETGIDTEAEVLPEEESKKASERMDVETEDTEVTEQPEEASGLFAKLKNEEFVFASGAGAWGTAVRIRQDGSFYGSYHDSDMGASGENYPKGTVYKCDFTGQFTDLVKVNDYTYSTTISEMTYEREAGTEELADDFLYIYSDAYGLQDAGEILLYLPGAPLAELPEEFRSWIGYYDLSQTEETELPFYALYNVVPQCGFRSSNLIENAKEMLLLTEESAILLEHSLENEALTQLDMNIKSQELYFLWDSALNSLWETLKGVLDEETMAALTVEEREWIVEKELAVVEAGAEYAGGSIQPLVENRKAAELTKERVYELMELLD